MKTSVRNPLMLPVLIAGLGLLAGKITAQTFTTLYSFREGPTNSSGVYTNSDGAYPFAELILSGHTLYGTANGGGGSDNGTVFAVNTDGTEFTILYAFAASSINPSGVYTNDDGAGPCSGLVSSGTTLYGTAY